MLLEAALLNELLRQHVAGGEEHLFKSAFCAFF
jgi:hypothetical protein